MPLRQGDKARIFIRRAWWNGFSRVSGVVKKSQRMESFVDSLGMPEAGGAGYDPCYLGYFACFNTQRYYEAHDVLEHLWLREGRSAPDYAFHKGLIQLAGAFVHLKLQRAHPEHPKHGRRLHPARRLFLLAAENLALYGPRHRGLDLECPLVLARRMAAEISEGELKGVPCNPWSLENAPMLPVPLGC